jgi:hypothetical protein
MVHFANGETIKNPDRYKYDSRVLQSTILEKSLKETMDIMTRARPKFRNGKKIIITSMKIETGKETGISWKLGSVF